MPTEPVSLRMDTAVLARTDAEVKRSGLTRTQIIEKALEHWFARSAVGGGMLPPGFTQQFQNALEPLAKSGGYITLLMLDPTGRPWTFTGFVPQHQATEALDSGFLTIQVQEPDELVEGPDVTIPRGSIIGWSTGRATKTLRDRLGLFWRAIDGNEHIARRRADGY